MSPPSLVFEVPTSGQRARVSRNICLEVAQVSPNEPIPSTKSFKAHIAVVLFTQAYRHIAQSMVAEFLPLAVDVRSVHFGKLTHSLNELG